MEFFPSIIHPIPPQPESQVKPQNDSPSMKKDKEPVYQLPAPTISASSRPEPPCQKHDSEVYKLANSEVWQQMYPAPERLL